jgi:hypothetical protein
MVDLDDAELGAEDAGEAPFAADKVALNFATV